MSPLTAFITGITTGGLTCMAVQGGLLLGLLAQSETSTPTRRPWSVISTVSAFLIAKIVVYTILGFGLGSIGEKLQLSSAVSVWLQFIAGAFILITGIRIIFPRWLPWLTITPPAAIRRFVRRQTKSDAWIAPALLGAITVLIPCGTTIAMETAAVATGSALQGAGILFGFTLGTAPLFLLVGVFAKGTALAQKKLAWVTAALVICLGAYTVNGALVMIDSPYTFQNEMKALSWAVSGGYKQQIDSYEVGSTNVTIEVRGTGYIPNQLTVQSGRPVTVNLHTIGQLGCTSVFRIPKLKIEKTLTPNSNDSIVTTFPQPGTYTFSCGMGMYTGTINAV